MILTALAERLKRRAEDDFKGAPLQGLAHHPDGLLYLRYP